MTTLQQVELGVLGPLQVRQYGLPVSIPGAKPRSILTMLGLQGGSVVSSDTLVELLWGDNPPRTAAKALQTHVSSLRRALGDGFVLTAGTGWTLSTTEVDATRYKLAAKMGRTAAASGDISQAVVHFDEALSLWRGAPELPDGQRGGSEKTRWIEGHAALVEDRADALLATGRAAEIVGELEAAIADAPLRERRWGQLMLALYRAGRQGEALAAYQRVRSLLADELGVDPGPNLRRLEAAIVSQDDALEIPVSQQLSIVTKAVTFLLTDIEGSTAAWEADAPAMAVALARHDEIVEQVVTSRGGRLIKTRGEGDATFSVFDRPSGAAAAAIELQEAIRHEPWALGEPMCIRVALHTGEVELRDGDYFGRAVNRAARLRSLATGGQILCSGATAELVIDTLSDDVLLVDLGTRQLKNLARPEHVFELCLETTDESAIATTEAPPMERPDLPAVLAGPGPFVGRGLELERLLAAWQTTLDAGTRAVLIAGEPGVGKTRLAGEWSRQAYEQGAVVLYGRCDEDLAAPYQPFAEALRALAPCLGANRLRGLRGVEALLALVPGLTDVFPDVTAPPRADADTERYALFDAVVAVLGIASASAPVVLVLDDLHWAAKPTLLLLRHLLRFGEHARVQIVGTYRSTDLDRSHPLAAMLADLHRNGSANRLQLNGLDEDDVTAYVAEAGYDDEELAHALASVTGGNPFFLIEALRHVDESGGHWDPNTLPQGVREAVSRRLSRLPAETNKALAAAAVVGSRFAIDLVERVVGEDLVDAFDEASKASIVIEEPGGRYRFNHAIVRQSLLAELASVRRMRLHQRIAAALETESGADEELLAELAYHYFECAWAGNAAKAVDYCRRAADQAMARLAYEGAADLYDKALHALDELDDELPDRADVQAELLVARCEALLAAGDVGSARGAVSQLQGAALDSARLGAWGTCFDGQLSMLTDPERLDEIETALGAAAEELAGLDDAAGEAKAHTVRAGCLARLGRIGDCETALDQALTAARRAGEHRRVNAVLAGAPLAALWGPNPVPRAGGRCLDVVRLLRITTGSPVVEATSTRCQAVLDALRGRAAAGRSLLDSARRTLTELGMRHALLEVEQFAGIVEMVADDPASAEPHLRRAYNGFRRMGLEADTAETAALLARVCLMLDRDAEADELCTESERLAGHALKPSIAWRTVRAQLLARGGAHDEARRVAQEAVAWAERTDLLVDHGDACLAMATVLGIAGDAAGARAAAEKAVSLYELKGAAALAEKARKLLGAERPSAQAPPEPPTVELNNACTRVIDRLIAALNREAWSEVEQLSAVDFHVESRRKVIAFTQDDLFSGKWTEDLRRLSRETGDIYYRHRVVAVRGERLALIRLELGTADESSGAPQSEMLQVAGLDQSGGMALSVWFDVEDIDAAMAELDALHARFEAQHPQGPLENAASRAEAQFNVLFAERRFDEIGALLTDDVRVEDRRRGLHRIGTDRATELAEVRAAADIGVETMASDVIAIRGGFVALVHTRFETSGPQAFNAEILRLVEVDSKERLVACIVFDPDDFDSAMAELDARYLAGEAAIHADTWSVIAKVYAAFNLRELLPTTPGWGNVDHRRGAAFAPGDMIAYIQAAWDDSPDTKIYIAAVHRLSNLGAVVTHVAHGISQEGFDAEWRDINVVTVEGDTPSRSELFNDADIDAALARFEELQSSRPKLQNAASQLSELFLAHFAAHDWDAIADLLTNGYYYDDRRRTVNSGLRHGRDHAIEDIQTAVDLGLWANLSSAVIATRGRLLALNRFLALGRDPEAIQFDVLQLVETDADERFAACVVFDVDDIDAAFEELDARYLAGEAAAHAHTWSLIAQGYAAANRGELAATAPGVVNIDHRRLAMIESGDLVPYLRNTFDELANISTHIEAVHRLTDLGAVFTHVGAGTSKEGFDAEWRMINVVVVDGDLLSRSEMFDEVDIDAAIARFDELSRPAPKLGNAANKAHKRLLTHLAAHDWDAMTPTMSNDIVVDDRRHVVNAGIRHGREAAIADSRAIADLGFTTTTSTAIATRGEHLILTRLRASGTDPELFQIEILHLVEIVRDDQIAAIVLFDPDDIDAAFAELDARYLAGEAAAHAHTWSVITYALGALNRHEVPATTTDFVDVDHRRVANIDAGGMKALLRTALEVTPVFSSYVEKVHQLSELGAVVTQVAHGTSQEGFDVEWRTLQLLTVEGDLINRCEVFDEADLDASLARFDELGRLARRLENAASRAYERMQTCFTARDWDGTAEAMAADIFRDDHRRVVSGEANRGREAAVAEAQASADLGARLAAMTVVAIRRQRLALIRSRFSNGDPRPEVFHIDSLSVVEVDGDDRVAAHIMFDPDDLEAAVAELDARYLAGDAAPYRDAWSVMTRGFAALNRREIPATSRDWVTIDHRRSTSFEPGELAAYIRSLWDVASNVTVYIETVYRVSDFGALVCSVTRGRTHEGFDAEWREINLATVDGELITRTELFDHEDLDAALSRFDELSCPAPRLENAASQVNNRFDACFAAREWDAMAAMVDEGMCNDDRRRVVGAGIRRGRDAEIANMRAIVDLGVKNAKSIVVATRGQRLALLRTRFSGHDEGPAAFHTEIIDIVEINADNRITRRISVDAIDFDAALYELDARYLAGEAAAHAHTWSAITSGYSALNRHEVPRVTPDFVNIDHRPGVAFASGELIPYIHAAWDVSPDLKIHIEIVHRLNNLGAVITHAASGTSQGGFDAEWRQIVVFTVDGAVSRCEMYEEADLDAALARFDELNRPAPRLENAASRVTERFQVCFAARDWDAMAGILTDDISPEDHRPVMRAGTRHGREVSIGDWRSVAEVGFTNVTSTVIALRGERLALGRFLISTGDQQPGAFHNDVLGIVEINADNRIATSAMFDLDDICAAFAEFDARYLAGEASTHSHTWSVIAQAFAATNRREIPEFMPDFVSIDHRRARAFAPGDLTAYIRATWDLAPDVIAYAEAVHRLSNLGAVFTQAVNGTSQDGFEAEWREICIATVEGDLINRIELFDEADLDAALARFEELSRPAQRLENTASQVGERYLAQFAARDWDAMAEILADDFSSDDRRRVVGAGVRQGRDAEIADMRAIADLGLTDARRTAAIATRGGRLTLSRVRFSGREHGPGAIVTDVLSIAETNADKRIAATVVFDPDDIYAAYEELDSRYLAGEAAAHAHTWSVVANAYAAVTRHEMPPTTSDWANIDHRRGRGFAPGEMDMWLRAAWDLTPDIGYRIEAVHRLNNLGAVVTHVSKGTTQQGFDAEWRVCNLVMVEGDLVKRCELFDEADLDAALVRFDELHTHPHRVENAATRVYDCYHSRFAARDWDAIAGMLAEDHRSDDRRRAANEGIRHGRDAEVASLKSVAGAGVTGLTDVVIATRGERLALCRTRGTTSRGFSLEVLRIVEIDADERIVARVAFDLEDIDAAYEELDSRYLAGEAAAHAHTWSVISALHRHELPELTPDCVNIDHRRGIAFASGDMTPYIGATLDDVPDFSIHLETVHRLNSFGAVVTFTSSGTSRGGFDAEWRMIQVLAVRGDMISHCELFDEEDLDTALEKFEELNSPAPRLENAASRVDDQLWEGFAARDWHAISEMLADDHYSDDRRLVVGAGIRHGRDAEIEDMRAVAAEFPSMTLTSVVMATRGERLVLTRCRYSGRADRPETFYTDVLRMTELDADERSAALVFFDPEDIEAAIEELDARYLVGEAAAHSQTWSVVANAYATLNRRELPATTRDWVNLDHRRGPSIPPGEMTAFLRVAGEFTPNASIYIEAVHRLTDLGTVFTEVQRGTSREGFDAEWRDVVFFAVDSDLINRVEVFDEADRDTALARFDELVASTPLLKNAGTRAIACAMDAFNRRDLDSYLAVVTADGRYEDRRKGLRDAGLIRPSFARPMFVEAPTSWQAEVDPIAIRGPHLALCRWMFRDHSEVDRPIAVEALLHAEVTVDELISRFVLFDPDDINGAFGELTARWIASRQVAHPEVIEAWHKVNEAYNRHDWNAVATHEADATYVNHRQLASGVSETIADHWRSMRALESLIPDLWVEGPEILTHSATGVVNAVVVKGTTTEGAAIELPAVILLLFDGLRVTRMEAFDPDQRDKALARFEELCRSIER